MDKARFVVEKNLLSSVLKKTQAEGLGDFFECLGNKGINISKKKSKTVIKIPSRASDITANITTAAASRNPEKVSSTLPEVINFYHTGQKLYVIKICFVLYRLKEKKIQQLTSDFFH